MWDIAKCKVLQQALLGRLIKDRHYPYLKSAWIMSAHPLLRSLRGRPSLLTRHKSIPLIPMKYIHKAFYKLFEEFMHCSLPQLRTSSLDTTLTLIPAFLHQATWEEAGSPIHPEVSSDRADINFYYQPVTYCEHSPGKGRMASSVQKE